ncbi:MAG: glycine-rich protein [Gemmatimonadales bacterium]|nr:glycine-rich protein [Gemmatimonadales bacterium]
MNIPRRVGRGLLTASGLLVVACGSDSAAPPRAPFSGDYAGFIAAAPTHALVPGDVITEANNWGGFYFTLSNDVTSVRISITGAAGSYAGFNGGTGGTGEFDLMPAFLSSQGALGVWVVLGEAGRPSAGEVTPITPYLAFNGGGAGTDWSGAENTYNRAAGGGGASDVRLSFAGNQSDPHAAVDACANSSSRVAVVGGGGGATDNGGATGGFGGGFNSDGGDGAGGTELGTGGTATAGGTIDGALCRGGNGLQDGTEGWAGGGGGGYYGGGASLAHRGGGGGSGYLLSDPDLVQVGTTSGVQGGNATTTRHGAFTITVN